MYPRSSKEEYETNNVSMLLKERGSRVLEVLASKHRVNEMNNLGNRLSGEKKMKPRGNR